MVETLALGLPFRRVLAQYKLSYLRRDSIAGLTVAAIAVPQAMAYAQLAGVNLTAGLYAAMVAMFVFALTTSSRHVIMGPDAAMAALAGSAVIPLAHGNMNRAIALIAILSIFIGIVSIISVFLRVGFIAEFLSRPILLGYMAGLALVVIATQLPKVFGLPSQPTLNFLGTIVYLLTNLSNIQVLSLLIGLAALLAGLMLGKTTRKIPAGLIIIVIGTYLSWLFGLSAQGVAVVGSVPSGLPVPDLPTVQLYDLQNLFIPAMAMMLIAYANTIATGRSFAARKRETVNADQELFGLGVSNIASGIYGGIPVSASGVRTAVNYTSNAKTQMSQLIAAVCIAVVLIVLSPLLRYLPIPILAVIIILAVLPLFNIRELRSIWHAWHSEAILAIITMVGVATLGIYQGLLLAVMLAILNIIRKSAFPNDAILGVAANGAVRDMSRPPKTTEVPGLKMYRFDAPLYFGNANYFRQRVLHAIDTSQVPVQWLLWDAETITSIDSTSGQMLVDLIDELHGRNIVFAYARMKGSVRQVIHHTNTLNHKLQRAPHFTSMGDGIEAYMKKTHPDL